MEEQSLKPLIRSLEQLECDDPILIEQVNFFAYCRIPYFTLSHESSFPDGTLELRLRCRRDTVTGIYSLENYNGTFIREIEITQDIINDIDLRELDSDMEDINWKEMIPLLASCEENQSCRTVLERLGGLGANGTAEGILQQNLLRIKYWSHTAWHDPSLNEQRKQYIRSQLYSTESLTGEGHYFCYYQLSGKYEQYLKELQRIGFNLMFLFT